MQNYLGELRIRALRENLRTISFFVQGLGERLNLDDTTLFEIELAVEEACTNIISHAYTEDNRGDIHLSAEVIGNAIRIQMMDWGHPFDPATVKPFDINAPVETRIKGGMGIHFIENLMDGVERIIPRRMGDPNILTLVKTIQQQGPRRRGRKRETQELAALQTVTAGIASGIHLDELLELIINKLVETIGAERGTLYLVDEAAGELWSKVLLEEEDVLPEIRVKIGQGSIAGQVAATGEALNILDAHEHPLFNPAIDRQTGYRTRTILTVPMRNPQQKVIGVVQLLNKINEDYFTARDERLLTAMSAQAAISIENARLYAHELERQLMEKELQTARSIQQSFLPEGPPQLPGWELDAFWLPMRNVPALLRLLPAWKMTAWRW
ncbi:MAG: GAF domain-containing protein [Anaerolineae bacterium]|nr:GAF domain-containing protein [Anaerolineae bacterium]